MHHINMQCITFKHIYQINIFVFISAIFFFWMLNLLFLSATTNDIVNLLFLSCQGYTPLLLCPVLFF